MKNTSSYRQDKRIIKKKKRERERGGRREWTPRLSKHIGVGSRVSG